MRRKVTYSMIRGNLLKEFGIMAQDEERGHMAVAMPVYYTSQELEGLIDRLNREQIEFTRFVESVLEGKNL